MEKSKYLDSPLGEKKGRGSSLPLVGSPSVAFPLFRLTSGDLYDNDSVLLSEGQPHAVARARVRGSAVRTDVRETEVRARRVAGAPGQTAFGVRIPLRVSVVLVPLRLISSKPGCYHVAESAMLGSANTI